MDSETFYVVKTPFGYLKLGESTDGNHYNVKVEGATRFTSDTDILTRVQLAQARYTANLAKWQPQHLTNIENGVRPSILGSDFKVEKVTVETIPAHRQIHVERVFK